MHGTMYCMRKVRRNNAEDVLFRLPDIFCNFNYCVWIRDANLPRISQQSLALLIIWLKLELCSLD